MTREESLQIAIECWDDSRTEAITIIPSLAEVFAEQLFIATNPGAHFCTEWDFLLIAPGETEWEACSCIKQ